MRLACSVAFAGSRNLFPGQFIEPGEAFKEYVVIPRWRQHPACDLLGTFLRELLRDALLCLALAFDRFTQHPNQ